MVPTERDWAKSTRPNVRLLDLPLIILRLIFEELYPDDRGDLLTIRLASRVCRSEADVLLFRSVRISEPGDKGDPRWLLKRLGDPKDTLASHVRYLQIGPFFGDERRYDEVSSQLEQVFSNLRGLRSLSWNTDALFSRGALKVFHEMCPAAQLNVVQKTRRWKPIDRDLLSSPQLHSLNMDVYYLTAHARSDFEDCSELANIKRCLLKGNSIKALHLTGHNAILFSHARSEEYKEIAAGWQTGPLNFQWHEENRFPALQEFQWGMDSRMAEGVYDFSAEQPTMWPRCTNWSILRILKLGPYTHVPPFFQMLTGKTPHLRRLTFSVVRPIADHSIISAFLGAIIALEYVWFRCLIPREFLTISSMVIDHHGQSLTELDLGLTQSDPNWTRQQYEDLFEKAPMISYFRMEKNSIQSSREAFVGNWMTSRTKLTARQKYDMMKKEPPAIVSSVHERASFGLPWQG